MSYIEPSLNIIGFIGGAILAILGIWLALRSDQRLKAIHEMLHSMLRRNKLDSQPQEPDNQSQDQPRDPKRLPAE